MSSHPANQPIEARLTLRGEDVHWREIEGEVVILDGRAKRYLALNRSGADCWRLLAAGTTRPALISHLARVYGITGARAAADVDRLLEALVARSLVEGLPGR